MKVGIIGLGYVGLPLAAAFCEAGNEVIGVDSDPRVVDSLERGESHVEDVTPERLQAVGDRFCATTRYAELAKVDVAVIAVPTPLTRNREPDLGPLSAAGTALAGGADLVYNDDHVPELPDFGLQSEPLEDALVDTDCVVIVTAHPGLDVERIVREAPLVVDFRGVTRGIEAPNLVRL